MKPTYKIVFTTKNNTIIFKFNIELNKNAPTEVILLVFILADDTSNPQPRCPDAQIEAQDGRCFLEALAVSKSVHWC